MASRVILDHDVDQLLRIIRATEFMIPVSGNTVCEDRRGLLFGEDSGREACPFSN
jgi:hypothetical protein